MGNNRMLIAAAARRPARSFPTRIARHFGTAAF
jgi:hypothetical protein